MRRVATLLVLSLSGCISAPPIVIADRQTALEEQAGGSFKRLEEDLDRAGMSPRPEPFTRGELLSAGVPRAGIGESRNEDESDAELLDRLLLRRCIGEALDGTLVETPQTCRTKVDPVKQRRLVEQMNRNRWQAWRYLQAQRPGAPLDEVRRAWRRIHLQSVVCGGWVRSDDDKGWEPKGC